jgi:hypothetical protein
MPAPGIPTGALDITYGFITNPVVAGVTNIAGNRDVIAVLMNLEKFPNGTDTTNKNKVFNPRGLTPLNANYSGDTKSKGIGPDGEYRDPWGSSYVITMDTSLNDRCRDIVYSRSGISQDTGATGFYGLSNTNTAPAANTFEFGGQYMIWSLGPDGQVDINGKANKGVNRDNVLGWQ